MRPHPRLFAAWWYLAAVVVGAVLSTVTTIHHRSLPPWGALLGVLVIAGYAVALRLLWPGRGLALAGMLGVVTIQLALSSGWDGSLVVTAQGLGVGFTVGVIFVGVLSVSWPDLRNLARYDGNQGARPKEDRP